MTFFPHRNTHVLYNGQYFGDIDKSINVNGLILTKSHYRGHVPLPNHYHSNAYACFILNGRYSENFHKTKYECTRGDVLYHPSHLEHSNDFHTAVTNCLNLEFSDLWLAELAEKEIVPKKILKINEIVASGIFSKIHTEFQDCDSFSNLMIESLVIELLIAIKRNDEGIKASPLYVKKVARLIEESYNTHHSMHELARYANVSAEHLSRSFKRYYKMSIGEYSKYIRIKHACDLLINTKNELSEIAFITGFSDQSHFCRIFKKLLGVSPLEYRRNI